MQSCSKCEVLSVFDNCLSLSEQGWTRAISVQEKSSQVENWMQGKKIPKKLKIRFLTREKVRVDQKIRCKAREVQENQESDLRK